MAVRRRAPQHGFQSGAKSQGRARRREIDLVTKTELLSARPAPEGIGTIF